MPEQPSYASAAAVAGLAREVESVRRAVDGLRAVPARVDELAELVARLAEHTAAPGRPQDGGKVAGPPCWLALPDRADPAAVEILLVELVEWVVAVYLRYADARGLPACWLWHPDVVEELLWLRAAWHAAYTGPGASISLAGDWHDRQRPGVVRRIRAAAGVCSIENHQPGGAAHTPAGGAPLANAAPTIAGWWATGRDGHPPAPTGEQVAAAAKLRPRPGSGSGS